MFSTSICNLNCNALKGNTFAFSVSDPSASAKSNGISLVLQLCEMALSLGLNAVIVPGHALRPSRLSDFKCNSKVPICWDTPPDSVAIICDTICAERLTEIRSRAKKICHYSLAPKGLFQVPTGLLSHPLPGEASVVYSPQVSSKHIFYYFQTNFSFPENLFSTSNLEKPGSVSSYLGRKVSKIKTTVYAGKGRLTQVYDNAFLELVDFFNVRTITRASPRRKKDLYNILLDSDLLISFDPISSLNHESILLGTPVLVIPPWDEPDFVGNFPVCLDGISWGSFVDALSYVNNGYDLKKVRSSYSEALTKNHNTLIEFLEFCLSQAMSKRESETELAYWHSRQSFFKALSLPSVYPTDGWPGLKIFEDRHVCIKLYCSILLFFLALSSSSYLTLVVAYRLCRSFSSFMSGKFSLLAFFPGGGGDRP